MVRVGIPRALLYYYYYPLWKELFATLGCTVVVSDLTNKKILDNGIKNAVDEACLPIKLAFGHVANLAEQKVDYIFLPRLVSVARREYICPKFLGFPDMIKQNLTKLPEIIDTSINYGTNPRNIERAYKQAARKVSSNSLRIWQAYHRGCRALEQYRQLLEKGYMPQEALAYMYSDRQPTAVLDYSLRIAVIGHPYNIYDHYINMNLIKRLRAMGVKVFTADHLSEAEVQRQAAKLPKKIFWTLGQRMVGAGYHYGESDVDGIIHVSAFACGLDSMTGELIERHIRNTTKLPFLNLTLDEHTGEAGVVTRLEAFIDMVRRRKSIQFTST